MGRLLVIAVLLVIGWRLLSGRWPWQGFALGQGPGKEAIRQRRLAEARGLLGLPAGAGRDEVHAAHRRLVAAIHPDRGGSNAQVHEANAARDLLLTHLPHDPKERA